MIKRKNPYKPEANFRLNNVKITKDDIERNLKKIQNGEALDIPLILLNGKFKDKYLYMETYKQQLERNKKWRHKHNARVNAYHLCRYYKSKGKLNNLIEKSLWVLYYYNKEKGR